MTKKTIFIHIGHAKCGSSSIQYFCEENRDALLDDGVFYPPTSGLAFHGEISPTYWKTAGNPRDISGNIKRLKKAINSSPANKVVLSFEGFHQDDPGLFERLSEYNLRFIYYVRRQADYLESILNQRIKEGIISYALRWPIIVDFHGKISMFAHRFGREHVTLRVLESDFLVGADLIQDFLHSIGHFNRKKYTTVGRRNASLSGKYLKYAALIAQIPLTQLERRDIARELEALSAASDEDRVQLLSKAQRLIIASNNKQKNMRMADEFLSQYDRTLIQNYLLENSRPPVMWNRFQGRYLRTFKGRTEIKISKKLKMSNAEQLDVFSELSPTARSLILLRNTGSVEYDETRKIQYPILGRLARSSDEFRLETLRRDLIIVQHKINAMEEKLLQQTGPVLLEVYQNYNIVYCNRMIFAVPAGLPVDWNCPAEFHSNADIIVDHDIGRVRSMIDSSKNSNLQSSLKVS